ncbi:MAG: aldehyde dehydrogenase (NADP(+)) [Nocardioides sp.]
MTTTLTGEMFIGAERIRGTSGEVTGLDPRTGAELHPTYGLGSSAEVDRACELAAAAFASYRKTDLVTRAAFLDAIAEEIEDDGEQIVAQVVAETGIVEPRVRGELARTVNQLRLFATVVRSGAWTGARIDPALPDRTPLPRPDLRQRKVPVGPVAVFGASNFPLAFSVAGGDTASALAAGCPVVVKAHSSHPGTSELVAAAIRRAVRRSGLHEGVFSMLYGTGPVLGTALVAHPAIASVGFTGSRGGGLALMDTAARRARPIPVHAEMSSTNPVFLLPGALAERGAEIGRGYVDSLTVGVGQLCTNPGVVFAVEGPGLEEFLSAASAAVAASTGLPMLSPGIHDAFEGGAAALAEHRDVRTAATGESEQDIACEGVARLFVTDLDAFLADHALSEEVFGPSSVVVRVPDPGRLQGVVSELDGQLTATLHLTEADHELAAPLVEELELVAGRILVNQWPTGVEVSHAMVHGGPFPATSDSRTTSVGTLSIERFLRPVCYQNLPPALLPSPVDEANSWGVWRLVDGEPVAPR